MLSEYAYEDLRDAVKKNPTQENINALGEWFSTYGSSYWNGESFNADGITVWPVYSEEEDEYGCFELLRYELGGPQ